MIKSAYDFASYENIFTFYLDFFISSTVCMNKMKEVNFFAFFNFKLCFFQNISNILIDFFYLHMLNCMDIQKKQFSPIEVTDDGIAICVNDEHL